jgi:hypothetical protein
MSYIVWMWVIIINISFTLFNTAIIFGCRYFDNKGIREEMEWLTFCVKYVSARYYTLDCMQCVKGTIFDKEQKETFSND